MNELVASIIMVLVALPVLVAIVAAFVVGAGLLFWIIFKAVLVGMLFILAIAAVVFIGMAFIKLTETTSAVQEPVMQYAPAIAQVAEPAATSGIMDWFTSVAAWVTVVGIPLVIIASIAYLVYKIFKHFKAPDPVPVVPTPAPTWQSTETIVKSIPEPKPEPEIGKDLREWKERQAAYKFTSVAGDPSDEPAKIATTNQTYRVFSSANAISWEECGTGRTERAACNFAKSLKAAEPTVFVKVEDPTGSLVFFE
jgi:hypothetical protein